MVVEPSQLSVINSAVESDSTEETSEMREHLLSLVAQRVKFPYMIYFRAVKQGLEHRRMRRRSLNNFFYKEYPV